MEELRKIFSDAIHKGMNTSVSPIQIRINEIEDNCAIEAKKIAIAFKIYSSLSKNTIKKKDDKKFTMLMYTTDELWNNFIKEYYVR